MRTRAVALLACAVVLASSSTASVTAAEARVETQAYVTDGLFIAGHGNLGGQGHNLTVPAEATPVTFDPRPGDRFVELGVDDDLGPWPLVSVRQEMGHGHHGEMAFCASSRRIVLSSSQPIEVSVYSGFCHNHTYGVATTGTITATFIR